MTDGTLPLTFAVRGFVGALSAADRAPLFDRTTSLDDTVRERTAARASSSSVNNSVPASRTWPLVGTSSPAMIDSRVLLPEPEAPTMATDSCARSSKLMSWRMVNVPVASATCLVMC